jgi:lysine-N-methylase
VPIDRQTFEKYQNLPDVPLRALIQSSVVAQPAPADGSDPVPWAKIQMTPANQCPLLSDESLCRVQSECGESFLSHTCAVYPRVINSVDGAPDKSLSLSCPEAARLVLLQPDLLDTGVHEIEGGSSAESGPQSDLPGNGGGAPFRPLAHFWPIRAAVLSLLRQRTYPLWQRLFLLGIFCRRMDAIARGELNRPVADFLDDFERAVATKTLLPAMETLPVDRSAQLDVVLRLAGMLLHRSNIRPRFVACIEAFTSGIGNGPQATLDSLTSHYAEAHDRYYAPFFARHPYILENYLINTIFRTHFPFGRSGAKPSNTPDMTREFAMLTAQFTLMKGLLIGVAGHHRMNFEAAHVVHTMQAASKHFEHHPEFLNQAHALLVESHMDGARGLAILLRNTDPVGVARTPAPQVQVPEQQAGSAA